MITKVLRFIKVEHTAFSLPLLLTGAWLGGQGQWPSLRIMAWIMVAAVGARIFGMSFNRIFDRRLDARNPRTASRELPGGSMHLKTALLIAFSGLLVYLMACYFLSPLCLYLAPVPLIPLLGYSLLKRYTMFCHFGIGLCLALAPLGAYTAVAGHMHFSPAVLLFSGFVFFWLSGADIIYAILDIESDRENKVYSIPAGLGEKNAQYFAAVVHLASLLCLILLLLISKAGAAAFTAFWITVVFFITLYMPFIPVAKRFFPLATLAGVAGAVTPLLN